MFQMVLESNPEKLANNGIKSEEFNSLLKAICIDTDFKEKTPNHYYLEDKYDELNKMFILEAKFRKLGYVIPNLKRWITYSDEEGEVNELE